MSEMDRLLRAILSEQGLLSTIEQTEKEAWEQYASIINDIVRPAVVEHDDRFAVIGAITAYFLHEAMTEGSMAVISSATMGAYRVYELEQEIARLKGESE